MVLYNSPYSPQLNAIEFSFSKLKDLVKKVKPTSEKDLIEKVLTAFKQITDKDCSEFIVHSLTFVEPVMGKEDFF